MTAIRTFFQEFWNRIPQIGVNDIIDILIVAFLFYTVMRLIHSTSAEIFELIAHSLRFEVMVLIEMGHHFLMRATPVAIAALATAFGTIFLSFGSNGLGMM